MFLVVCNFSKNFLIYILRIWKGGMILIREDFVNWVFMIVLDDFLLKLFVEVFECCGFLMLSWNGKI